MNIVYRVVRLGSYSKLNRSRLAITKSRISLCGVIEIEKKKDPIEWLCLQQVSNCSENLRRNL